MCVCVCVLCVICVHVWYVWYMCMYGIHVCVVYMCAVCVWCVCGSCKMHVVSVCVHVWCVCMCGVYMHVVCVCVACAWGVNKRRRRILESKGLKSECITYMYNFYFAWVGGGAAPLALWIPSIWNGKSFIQLSMLSCFKAATGTQKGSGSGKMTVLRFFSLPDPSRLKKMTPPYIYLLGSFPKCASKCLR